jgi:hypothetical protein
LFFSSVSGATASAERAELGQKACEVLPRQVSDVSLPRHRSCEVTVVSRGSNSQRYSLSSWDCNLQECRGTLSLHQHRRSAQVLLHTIRK